MLEFQQKSFFFTFDSLDFSTKVTIFNRKVNLLGLKNFWWFMFYSAFIQRSESFYDKLGYYRSFNIAVALNKVFIHSHFCCFNSTSYVKITIKCFNFIEKASLLLQNFYFVVNKTLQKT